MDNVTEHFCIPMTDGSFRIHHVTSAPYTNGSTTIRIPADATLAETTKAILKATRYNEKEFARYLINAKKHKAYMETVRREVLSYRSPAYLAGVADGMDETNY